MTSVREGIIHEIFQPARKTYPRMKIDIRGLYETLSADLMDMQKHGNENDGYNYILTVIDNFSKYAWAIPVKHKTGPAVTEAMSKILDEDPNRPIKNLHTDEGGEFFNGPFKKLMKKHGINLYYTYSGIKNPIVERFNRTLRHLMEPELYNQGNNKWLALLPRLINFYNNKKHRTIKMTPVEATDPGKEKDILKNVYEKELWMENSKKKKNKRKERKKKGQKWRVGDHVRISKRKLLFEKGYTPNYSMEIFKIVEIKKSKPPTFLLQDIYGKEIKGRFYEHEIKKTKYPNQYLVEKLIKKKKNKYYVKFLGFDKPEWINKKDFV